MDSLIGLLIIWGIVLSPNVTTDKTPEQPSKVKVYKRKSSGFVNCYGWKQTGVEDGFNR